MDTFNESRGGVLRGNNHKERVLKLLRFLVEESDENNRYTTTELMRALDLDESLYNNRRNVNNDLSVLQKCGFKIQKVRHKSVEYYFRGRKFLPGELAILCDVVQSSRAITEETSNNLIDSLTSLGSTMQQKIIDPKIHACNRVKSENRELFSNLETIQKALSSAYRNKITFKYFHYDYCFRRKYHKNNNGNNRFEESPIQIAYSEGFYYLVSFDDINETTKTRRVDRMESVMISEKKITWSKELQSFDLDLSSQFGMFISGEPVYVTFNIKSEKLFNAFIDKFGRENIKKILTDESVFVRVRVKVFESEQLYGWVCGLGSDVELIKPKRVVENYFNHLEKIKSAIKMKSPRGQDRVTFAERV